MTEIATVVDIKRYVEDFAKLEGGAMINIGTTGFAGWLGSRLAGLVIRPA